jgi:hypothetical protein
MAIASAVQRGSMIFVYNERGNTLFVKTVGLRPGDGLQGYTGSAVTVRDGSIIHTYDAKGNTLFVRSS